MRIVHICLANFYIENMEYQENVLPRKHQEMGHEVFIITSRYTFNSFGEKSYRDVGDYITMDGVKVTILAYYPVLTYIMRVLRVYSGLYYKLNELHPDIIFIHGAQAYSMFSIIRYKKKFLNVKIFADQHGDYYNMPIDTFTKKILNKYIFGLPVKCISKYVDKFWGVTPWRVQYLHEVYKIPKEKIDLLVMGGDKSKIDFENITCIKKKYREKIGIKQNDFLVITGGKIDKAKNIHLLVQAVEEITNERLKLVVFGDIKADVNEFFKNRHLHDNIKLIGWIESSQAYNWFLASDLAVFPGTHSVLWEQAIATGLPAVFKYWEGMQHVDVGGNCVFLKKNEVNEIKNVIEKIVNNESIYLDMKNNAAKGIELFSYEKIAKKAIGLE